MPIRDTRRFDVKRSRWLASLVSRKRKQVATVAVANKMARMVWAVLCKGEAYRPPLVPQIDAA